MFKAWYKSLFWPLWIVSPITTTARGVILLNDLWILEFRGMPAWIYKRGELLGLASANWNH